jgi:hypothetical protein
MRKISINQQKQGSAIEVQNTDVRGVLGGGEMHNEFKE